MGWAISSYLGIKRRIFVLLGMCACEYDSDQAFDQFKRSF